MQCESKERLQHEMANQAYNKDKILYNVLKLGSQG